MGGVLNKSKLKVQGSPVYKRRLKKKQQQKVIPDMKGAISPSAIHC